jgi:hypothetical protein
MRSGGASMANIRKKSGYSAKDLREVSDTPRLTKADFAEARPFAEVFPDLSASVRKETRTKGAARKAVKRKTS